MKSIVCLYMTRIVTCGSNLPLNNIRAYSNGDRQNLCYGEDRCVVDVDVDIS